VKENSGKEKAQGIAVAEACERLLKPTRNGLQILPPRLDGCYHVGLGKQVAHKSVRREFYFVGEVVPAGTFKPEGQRI
jgi:hypothetical protein